MIICTIAIVLLFFSFWSIIRAGNEREGVDLVQGKRSDSAWILGISSDVINWKIYISNFRDFYISKIEAIRDYVINNGLVGYKENITTDHYFLFKDGTSIVFSNSGWIDFQFAITSNRKYQKYRRNLLV